MFYNGNLQKGESNMINDYGYQSKANIQCLLEDVEYSERKEALFTIYDELNKANIRWGLACSTNLFIRGVVDEFHDLDFIVDIKSISKIEKIMGKLGAILKETGGNGYCESDIYMHFQFGRIDIDFISGFRVMTFGTHFEYYFNPEELQYINFEERNIPLISMEALYLLYSMMEGWQARRRYKRVLIEEYLLSEELFFPHILKRSLKSNLPGWIKRNIMAILNVQK